MPPRSTPGPTPGSTQLDAREPRNLRGRAGRRPLACSGLAALTPGGIYLEEFPSETHGPHPGFDSFCELVTPLIGS